MEPEHLSDRNPRTRMRGRQVVSSKGAYRSRQSSTSTLKSRRLRADELDANDLHHALLRGRELHHTRLFQSSPGASAEAGEAQQNARMPKPVVRSHRREPRTARP